MALHFNLIISNDASLLIHSGLCGNGDAFSVIENYLCSRRDTEGDKANLRC